MGGGGDKGLSRVDSWRFPFHSVMYVEACLWTVYDSLKAHTGTLQPMGQRNQRSPSQSSLLTINVWWRLQAIPTVVWLVPLLSSYFPIIFRQDAMYVTAIVHARGSSTCGGVYMGRGEGEGGAGALWVRVECPFSCSQLLLAHVHTLAHHCHLFCSTPGMEPFAPLTVCVDLPPAPPTSTYTKSPLARKAARQKCMPIQSVVGCVGKIRGRELVGCVHRQTRLALVQCHMG